MTPPQYVVGAMDPRIKRWISNSYRDAVVFSTPDEAIEARRELGEFADLFEIVSKLEIAK